MKNTGANNYRRMAPGEHKTPGRARPPRRALVGCAQPSPPPVPIFWYIGHFDLEKKSGEDFRDEAPGTSLPEGEIEAIVITNNPIILGREISINIFNNTI